MNLYKSSTTEKMNENRLSEDQAAMERRYYRVTIALYAR